MFQKEDLTNTESWVSPNIPVNLIFYIVLKFFLTILAVSCPIPSGVFTPTFVLGAAIGRLYGLMVGYFFDLQVAQQGVYAIIGAAAMTASVTRTTSVAIIVFEMGVQLSQMVPVLLAVLVSYLISN